LQEMSGRWVVEPDPASAVGMATLLRFDISVQVRCAGCGSACNVNSNLTAHAAALTGR
jgi:hypothetical protein